MEDWLAAALIWAGLCLLAVLVVFSIGSDTDDGRYDDGWPRC